MITIGNKEFRNIQEQVEKNKQDIASIQSGQAVLDEFGIKVVGQVSELSDLPTVADYKEAHEDWAYGDAYAVGTEAPYELYILTRADEENHPNDYWFNIGSFPAPGPEGQAGQDGFSPQVSISNIEDGHSVSITDADGTQTFNVMDGSDGTNGSDGKSTIYYNGNLSTVIGDYTTITLPNAKVNDLVVSLNGIVGLVTNISNGVIVQTQTSIVGPRGPQGQEGPASTVPGPAGADGEDGISPSVTVTTITGGHEVSITDANGTSTFDVMDGINGTNGTDGQDGISPVINASATVDSNVGTPTVTVTKSGTDASPTFTFAFSNIKGEKGDPGTSTIGIQVVNSLPSTGEEGIIYLVPSSDPQTQDSYEEYIYTNNSWERIGGTSIDLTNYIQKSSTSGLVKNDGTIDTNTYALASSLSTVATTGDYDDLTDKPDLSNYVDLSSSQYIYGEKEFAAFKAIGDLVIGDPTLVSNILLRKHNDPNNFEIARIRSYDGTNASTYALKFPNIENFTADKTIATTDQIVTSYNDLTDKPTIPTVPITEIQVNSATVTPVSGVVDITVPSQVNADWNSNSGLSQILNKPTLALVATSGSYNDLVNKPTFATVATSGSYNDLTDKPTIPTVSYPVTDVQVDGTSVLDGTVAKITMPSIPTFTQQQANWNELDSTAVSYIQNKPNLATVATSGNYNDLSNKPTIPEDITIIDLENSISGTLTTEQYALVTNTPNKVIFRRANNLYKYKETSNIQYTYNFIELYNNVISEKHINVSLSNATWSISSESDLIVEDVKVDGVSVVSNHVANITMPTIPEDITTITLSLGSFSGTLSASDLAKVNANPNKILFEYPVTSNNYYFRYNQENIDNNVSVYYYIVDLTRSSGDQLCKQYRLSVNSSTGAYIIKVLDALNVSSISAFDYYIAGNSQNDLKYKTTASSTYSLKFPTTSAYTADKTIATTADALPVEVLTTEPSVAYTGPGLKVVYLSAEPSTKYAGYIYMIAES